MPRTKAPEPALDHYRDTGCRWFRACLTCPLPACVFDLSDHPGTGLRRVRAQLIRDGYAAGVPLRTLATRFDLSERSVRRIVGGVRAPRGPRRNGP